MDEIGRQTFDHFLEQGKNEKDPEKLVEIAKRIVQFVDAICLREPVQYSERKAAASRAELQQFS